MTAPATFRPHVLYGSSIRADYGYDANSYTYYPVVIIGAGEAGIAMGCRLREVLAFDQFRIFDKQSGIGGTWWINRYPGVACDVPAVFYSFSFAQNPGWSSFHPSGSEIVKYLQSVCSKYQIVDKIQLNTCVKESRWNEKDKIWEVIIQYLTPGTGELSNFDRLKMEQEEGVESVVFREETVRTKVLISAVGGLVEPRTWPESIPGREKFKGEVFHSARWRYDVDLKDKDVIVVGTGCSAAQFVPKLTKEYGVKSVTQIMRSPPWVAPRVVPPWGDKKWEERGPWVSTYVPGFVKTLRFLIAAGGEYNWRLFGSSDWNKKERAKLEEQLLARMRSQVPQKYHEILTPDYSVCCKRRIFDATWFPGLNDANIELTTLPLTSVQEKSVTLGPGRTYPPASRTDSKAPTHEVTIPADVIVLANGFDVVKWFHPMNIYGRDGKTLDSVFKERGGPQMYMGLTMDGFPNFYTLMGPNMTTGHSSVVMTTENMVNFTLKLIAPALRGDVATMEVKKEAEIAWATDIQRASKQTVFLNGGCQSWYKTETDWNSVVYPYSQIKYWFHCVFPTWSDWNITYTKKGLVKRRAKKFLRCLVYAALFTGVYRAQKQGTTLRDLPNVLKGQFRMLLFLGAGLLQKTGSMV